MTSHAGKHHQPHTEAELMLLRDSIKSMQSRVDHLDQAHIVSEERMESHIAEGRVMRRQLDDINDQLATMTAQITSMTAQLKALQGGAE